MIHTVTPKHANTKMLTQSQSAPETQRTNLALPVDLYEAVRKAAFERRVPQAQIVSEILRQHFTDKGEE